jgi:hypothetical protein
MLAVFGESYQFNSYYHFTPALLCIGVVTVVYQEDIEYPLIEVTLR